MYRRKMKSFKFHWGFFAATILLFIVEVLIAMYVRGFVRNYVGDVLVVILIYSFFRSFYRGMQYKLPVYVFLFALLIEIGQACHLVERLSLAPGSVMSIVIGTSFSWWDIVCYAVGGAVCFLFESKRRQY